MTANAQRRLCASIFLPLTAALGFAAAIGTPTAGADALPAVPTVAVPAALPPLPLPPAVGGITVPAPPVTTDPVLPVPTTTTAPTTDASAPGSEAAESKPAAVGEGGSPTSSARAGTTHVAGAVRLTNGLTSIPVSSVVFPDRLVIEQVRVSPATVTSRGASFTASVRIRDTRGYVVRGARVEIRSDAGARTLLGAVRMSGLDGRLVSTARVQKLPTAGAVTVRLLIRAYKAAGNPVGDVAAHARAAFRVGHRR